MLARSTGSHRPCAGADHPALPPFQGIAGLPCVQARSSRSDVRKLQANPACAPARGRRRPYVLSSADYSWTALAEGTQVAAEQAYAEGAWGGERTAAAESAAVAVAALSRAQKAVQEQQAIGSAVGNGGQSPATLAETQRLVETAMLAAVSGLAYTLGSLLKVESYMAYFLPLPAVLSAVRGGSAAGRKTVTATAFLLLVLMGPVKAASYVLMHGLTGAGLGIAWAARWQWGTSIAAVTAARAAGTVGYLMLTGWMLNENLLALLVGNVHSLLEQVASTLGMSGAPSPTFITVTICSLLLVNAVFYAALMHVIYAIVLNNMGYGMGTTPRFVRRHLFKGTPQGL